MDIDYKILQIIPATDGWYALYDPVITESVERGAPDKICYAFPVACWVLVEMTDHHGVEHRWVDGLGEGYSYSDHTKLFKVGEHFEEHQIYERNEALKGNFNAESALHHMEEYWNRGLCSEHDTFRKFIYDPARTRVLRSQLPKVEIQEEEDGEG
jgi:hypothetical protein